MYVLMNKINVNVLFVEKKKKRDINERNVVVCGGRLFAFGSVCFVFGDLLTHDSSTGGCGTMYGTTTPVGTARRWNCI